MHLMSISTDQVEVSHTRNLQNQKTFWVIFLLMFGHLLGCVGFHSIYFGRTITQKQVNDAISLNQSIEQSVPSTARPIVQD